jgi:beta-glucosidase-like glycosyl hydrolase
VQDQAILAEIDHNILKTWELRKQVREDFDRRAIQQKEKDKAEREAQAAQRVIEVRQELDKQEAKKKQKEEEELRWKSLSKAQRRKELRDRAERNRLRREQRDQELEQQRRRLKEDLSASTWEDYQQRRARYKEKRVVEMDRQSAERWRYGRWETERGIQVVTLYTNEMMERARC